MDYLGESVDFGYLDSYYKCIVRILIVAARDWSGSYKKREILENWMA